MFANITIRTRLYLLAGVSILFLAVLAVSSYLGLEKMESLAEDLANNNAKLVEISQRERVNINLMRRFEKDLYINIGDAAKMEDYRKKWEGAQKAFDRRLEESAKLVADSAASDRSENNEIITSIKKNMETYAGGFAAVYELIKAGKIKTTQDANKAIGQYKKATHNAEAQVEDFAKKMDGQMTEKIKETIAGSNKVQMILLTVAILAAALAAIQAFVVIRSITKPLAKVIGVLATVASGDLKARSGMTSRDEMGILASEVDQMAEKLADTIGRVSLNSTQVAIAANRVHALAGGLSKNSEALASQSTAIATASEEMAATSSDIAHNCNDAAHEGKGASEVAVSGADVVDKTVTGMMRIAERVKGAAAIVEELGHRSNQIGEIIGTIEDIADQTNLLALNAAIEAARAGEQGRGFAVVADEVRALAERTTRATREIGDMIKTIQKETQSAVTAMEEGVVEVERGSEGAAQSGEALQHILQCIDVVTQQVNQIATAAEEQTATTTEVSRNILNVTEIAHATSNESRDITTEANQLTSLSGALMDAISVFKIEENNSLIINKAKSAHMVFVGKIQAHLDGTAKTDPSTLPDHHGCNFGKWYDTMGTEHCGHLPIYKEIVQPHAKVHELGKAAIVAYNSGDRAKAAALCEEMVGCSITLLDILSELEKRCV